MNGCIDTEKRMTYNIEMPAIGENIRYKLGN